MCVVAGLLLAIGCSAAAETPRAALAVGISVDAPPLAFRRNGVVKGLIVDLARGLADALERDLQLRRIPERRLTDALRGGRIDVMFSQRPPAELDALGLATSSPLLATGQMALVRSDELDRFPRPIDVKLTTAKVGYERGSLGARFVQARLPRAERVPFADAAAGLAALRAGDIDLLIHDATTAWTLAADPDETELIGLYQALSDEQLRLVTRREDASLRRELERVLDDWRRSGRLARLISRWLPIQIRVGEHISPAHRPAAPSSARAAPRPAARRDTT